MKTAKEMFLLADRDDVRDLCRHLQMLDDRWEKDLNDALTHMEERSKNHHSLGTSIKPDVSYLVLDKLRELGYKVDNGEGGNHHWVSWSHFSGHNY